MGCGMDIPKHCLVVTAIDIGHLCLPPASTPASVQSNIALDPCCYFQRTFGRKPERGHVPQVQKSRPEVSRAMLLWTLATSFFYPPRRCRILGPPRGNIGHICCFQIHIRHVIRPEVSAFCSLPLKKWTLRHGIYILDFCPCVCVGFWVSGGPKMDTSAWGLLRCTSNMMQRFLVASAEVREASVFLRDCLAG